MNLLNKRLYTTLMLILLTMVWGSTFPVTKAALSVTDPIQFLFLRFIISILILTPFLSRLRKQQYIQSQQRSFEDIEPYKLPSKKQFWHFGVRVGVFLFLGYALQVLGLKYTTASKSGFFTGLLVLIAPILAHIFKTSRTPLLVLAGIPLSILGVYLMADPRLGGLNIGDILTIGCAFAFSLQMVSLEYARKKMYDPWGLTFSQNVIVSLGALTWILFEGSSFNITSFGWFAAVYTGIFGSIVAGWLQTRFQPETTAGHASLIFTLEPVFAMLFAWILLGEGWTMRSLAGSLAILLAMVWASFVILKQKE